MHHRQASDLALVGDVATFIAKAVSLEEFRERCHGTFRSVGVHPTDRVDGFFFQLHQDALEDL
jgi:hypothetical protein